MSIWTFGTVCGRPCLLSQPLSLSVSLRAAKLREETRDERRHEAHSLICAQRRCRHHGAANFEASRRAFRALPTT